MARYKMRFKGFIGVVKNTEEVEILDIQYGVCHVKTDDGREDFAHQGDLIRLEEKE